MRVHRGPEAARQAGELDARAFTHEGEIFLPASHGPLNGDRASSLLAHEMTHVAQQRRFGSSLPHEDSPHGQKLEAEAVAAEHGHSLTLPLAPAPPKPEARKTTQGNDVQRSSSAAAQPGFRAPSSGDGVHGLPQRAPQYAAEDPDAAFREQLDGNVEYLFGRFERRLRRLLIAERERGGTLIDAL